MQDILSGKESLCYDLSKSIHISQVCSSSIACISDHGGIVVEPDCWPHHPHYVFHANQKYQSHPSNH